MSSVHEGRGVPATGGANKTGILVPNYAFGGWEKQSVLLLAEGGDLPLGRADQC